MTMREGELVLEVLQSASLLVDALVSLQRGLHRTYILDRVLHRESDGCHGLKAPLWGCPARRQDSAQNEPHHGSSHDVFAPKGLRLE